MTTEHLLHQKQRGVISIRLMLLLTAVCAFVSWSLPTPKAESSSSTMSNALLSVQKLAKQNRSDYALYVKNKNISVFSMNSESTKITAPIRLNFTRENPVDLADGWYYLDRFGQLSQSKIRQNDELALNSPLF